MAGHLHSYERNAPMYQNQTIFSEIHEQNYYKNPQAPIHIVSGSSGSRMDHNDPLVHEKADWNYFNTLENGIGRLIIYNDTHAQWEYYSANKKKLIDHLLVHKTETKYNTII